MRRILLSTNKQVKSLLTTREHQVENQSKQIKDVVKYMNDDLKMKKNIQDELKKELIKLHSISERNIDIIN